MLAHNIHPLWKVFRGVQKHLTRLSLEATWNGIQENNGNVHCARKRKTQKIRMPLNVKNNKKVRKTEIMFI
jgi:hypothetical protein